MSATLVEPSDTPLSPDSQTADALAIAANLAPWSGVRCWFLPQAETAPGQFAVSGGTAGEEGAWFRFARRSRDRWLRENPY